MLKALEFNAYAVESWMDMLELPALVFNILELLYLNCILHGNDDELELLVQLAVPLGPPAAEQWNCRTLIMAKEYLAAPLLEEREIWTTATKQSLG